MRDLKSSRLMLLKAILFVLIGALSTALLLWESPTLRTAALLALVIWSFARAYYFAFYVIEHYIDPTYKFAGLFSAARFLLTRPRR
ncbi:MAG TPA: hypothetical protein VHM90_04770 [Phycisphaerae bacterium]|jgi:hypothetical protein|nr:hypothetical protein [Phycisphaerae bacterium]